MRAKALLGGLVLVALGAIPGWRATLAAPATGSDGIGAEPVATGLEYPAGFTFAPDGRILYAELLTGEIRIFDPSTGSDTLFYTVSGAEQGQMGLISLAVHPRYPTTPYIYAYASRFVQGAQRNQILRIVDDGGVGANARVIYSVLMLGVEHFGAHMVFGRDRMLYVVTGEQGDPANAQDLDNTLGKVLRMTDRGRVPPDNPFPDSLVWAFGIRNSIGLAVDPLTGNLWEEDNGPECNDEINRIEPALNYGWGPAGTCDSPIPRRTPTRTDPTRSCRFAGSPRRGHRRESASAGAAGFRAARERCSSATSTRWTSSGRCSRQTARISCPLPRRTSIPPPSTVLSGGPTAACTSATRTRSGGW
jgi:glucose/arabinose dehydrogenase